VSTFEEVIAPYLDAPPLGHEVDLARIGTYRGLGEMFEAIDALRARGARVDVAARTYEGAPVLRVEIGPQNAKRGSLLIAGTHAMEWIGIETALSILDAAIDEPGDRLLIAFPILNPDGVRKAELDLRSGRKMRFVRSNARGVDLNRNWPTHWRDTGLVPRLVPLLGSAGTCAGSEPEVRAVLDAIDRAGRTGTRLERAVSLHSFGKMLLLPYGGRFALPKDHEGLHRLASEVRSALPTRYRIRVTSRCVPGYFVRGMELDHLYEQGMEPLLVECSGGGLSLRDPSSWIVPFRWYNPPDPSRHSAELSHALLPFLRYVPAR
jgi:hypothetical protein